MSADGEERIIDIPEVTTDYLEIAGLRRRVLSWGDNRNCDAVVLLCHGYGEHLERYSGLAKHLASRRSCVVGIENPGHGRSDGKRGSLPAFEDILDALDVVMERRMPQRTVPLVVLGHSLGGLTATRYAQTTTQDVSGLILSAPVLGDWSALSYLLAQDELPRTAVRSDQISTVAKEVADYDSDPLIHRGGFDWPTVFAIRDALNAANEFVGALDIPALWLHGTRDRMVTVADSRGGMERLKDQAGVCVRELIYEDARHELLHDSPRERVMESISSFINDIKQ